MPDNAPQTKCPLEQHNQSCGQGNRALLREEDAPQGERLPRSQRQGGQPQSIRPQEVRQSQQVAHGQRQAP